MTEFIDALIHQRFLQYALLASLLAAVACGIVGTYVVTKKITFLSGGIAHSVLGGLGAAHYLQTVHGWPIHPIHGAVVAALLAAVIIAIVSPRVGQHEDTVIGALWAVGMAIGLIFISRTPGYSTDLMSYLFGNILMVQKADLIMIAVLDVAVIILTTLLYKQFLAVCFDDQYAKLQGINTSAYYLLLLCMSALTVVVLIQVVGLILVIALLTLPAAIARQFVQTVRSIMLLAIVLAMIFSVVGLGASYSPDLPAGATIIVIAGAAYLLSTTVMVIIKHSPFSKKIS